MNIAAGISALSGTAGSYNMGPFRTSGHHPVHIPLLSRLIVVCLTVCLTAAVFRAAGRSAPPAVVEKTRLLMGTVIEIKAVVPHHSGPGRAEHAVDLAFAEIARLERIFSVYLPGSEASRLNRLIPGERMRVSPELFAVISRAVSARGTTDGVFDVTIPPLRDLWRHAASSGVLPDQREIDEARSHVDASAIMLDNAASSVAFSRPGMAIDLGGIAKGYAADRAAVVLRANGIVSALINAGGDMRCMGERPGGGPWKVGVRHPRRRDALACEISLTDRGIDTSGDYERYAMVAGRRCSHIIDPRRGIPVGDTVVSATVIAPDSATADIYATALCILGEDGLTIVRQAGLDALIILNCGGRLEMRMTNGMEKRYAVTRIAL